MSYEDADTLDDLRYRYLCMIEDEGCLNEVWFDMPELDEEPYAYKYTKEFYGVERLMAMIPDDVLINNFEAWRVLPLLEERDRLKSK